MDVTAIPFNKFIGLAEADDERYVLMLPEYIHSNNKLNGNVLSVCTY